MKVCSLPKIGGFVGLLPDGPHCEMMGAGNLRKSPAEAGLSLRVRHAGLLGRGERKDRSDQRERHDKFSPTLHKEAPL